MCVCVCIQATIDYIPFFPLLSTFGWLLCVFCELTRRAWRRETREKRFSRTSNVERITTFRSRVPYHQRQTFFSARISIHLSNQRKLEKKRNRWQLGKEEEENITQLNFPLSTDGGGGGGMKMHSQKVNSADMGVALYRSTRIDREYLPFFPTTTWRRCSLSLSFVPSLSPNALISFSYILMKATGREREPPSRPSPPVLTATITVCLF